MATYKSLESNVCFYKHTIIMTVAHGESESIGLIILSLTLVRYLFVSTQSDCDVSAMLFGHSSHIRFLSVNLAYLGTLHTI